MKKSFPFIREQRGFIMPFTLFILAIVLSILTTQVAAYQNDMHISHNYQEKIKIETLIQMGWETFKQDITSDEKTNGSVTYQFPPGNVSIDYEQIEDDEYTLEWNVSSSNKSYHKRTNMKLDSSIVKNE